MDRYYWPGLAQDVKNYIRTCDVCHMSKLTNHKPYGMFGKFREAYQPWQMISADIIGPLPRSKQGNTNLLVICDWFTEFPILIPLKKATAKNVVKNIESRAFHDYGIPEVVIMDNGRQFTKRI